MSVAAGGANRPGNAVGVFFGFMLVKSLLFALLIPPWLGNDEPNHFEYVLVISGTADVAGAQQQILDSLHRTDYWKRSQMPAPAGKATAFEHTELKMHSEDFVGTRSSIYYRLAALPVRLLPLETVEGKLLASRMVSVALSLLTVWVIYLSALAVFGGGAGAALLAVALAGFHPQLSYLSAVVNSDALMFLLFSLAFYWCVRMIKGGDVSPENIVVLFALVALSLLAKKHAVALVPIALGGILFATRGVGGAVKALLVFVSLLVVGAVALEFIVPREMVKLIDRIGLSAGVFFAGPEEMGGLSAMQWVRGFAVMFVTFWFTYGQMVYKQSVGFYAIYAAFSATAAVGLVIAHFQNARGAKDAVLSRLMLFSLLFVGIVLSMNIVTFFSPQWIDRVSGRYLFYAVAPLAVLAAAGIRGAASAACLPAYHAAYLMAAFNAVALFFYLVPLYG